MSLNLKLINGYAAVKRSQPTNKTSGGIILTQDDHPDQGVIVALSEKNYTSSQKEVPWDVEVGDTIIFGKFSGVTIQHEGEEYLLMKESEIFAVV